MKIKRVLVGAMTVPFLFFMYNRAMSETGGRMDNVLNGRLRMDHANNRLLVTDENNVNKLLAGMDADGNVKIKLAQDGIDVLTAADSDLIFSSDFNSFKIVDVFTDTNPSLSHTGTAGIWGSTTRNHNIPHTYGFIPVVIAVINDGSAYWPLPFELIDPTPYFIKIAVKADAENITVNTTIMAYGASVTYPAKDIKYYILRDTAN